MIWDLISNCILSIVFYNKKFKYIIFIYSFLCSISYVYVLLNSENFYLLSKSIYFLLKTIIKELYSFYKFFYFLRKLNKFYKVK